LTQRKGAEMEIPVVLTSVREKVNSGRATIVFDSARDEYRVRTFDLLKQESISHPLPDALQAQFLAENLAPAEVESSLLYHLWLTFQESPDAVQGG